MVFSTWQGRGQRGRVLLRERQPENETGSASQEVASETRTELAREGAAEGGLPSLLTILSKHALGRVLYTGTASSHRSASLSRGLDPLSLLELAARRAIVDRYPPVVALSRRRYNRIVRAIFR